MDTLMEKLDATFVHAAEVWIPNGDSLVLSRGDYRALEGFGSASAEVTFARGEGLPGKAWAEARPVVLHDFEGSYFQRQDAARAAGLTSAVAIPIFAETTLKAVLVVLCGGAEGHRGAIEVWAGRDGELTLEDGYYGDATEFADASKGVSFARGVGLPGTVWAARTPIVMRDIGKNHNFIRAETAGKVGLKTGLGLPVSVPGGPDYVMTLLSAPDTPIAHRFEVWDARHGRGGTARSAVLVDGICERAGPLWSRQNPPVDPPTATAWQGAVGQVIATGRPHVENGGTGLPQGYTSMAALPVFRGPDLSHVVAWYV